MKHMLSCSVLALGLAVVGCSSGSQTPPPAERVENPSAGMAEKPSNLSFGTVRSQVKKGVTTKLDIVELFGGANVQEYDRDGVETWVYDRSSSVTDTAGNSQADQMAAFFGAGGGGAGVVAGGGVSGGRQNTSDQRRTVNSVKNITVIIKFNPDSTVKDYTVRSSSF